MADSKEWARLGSRSAAQVTIEVAGALCCDDPRVRHGYIVEARTSAEEAVRLLMRAEHEADHEVGHIVAAPPDTQEIEQ